MRSFPVCISIFSRYSSRAYPRAPCDVVPFFGNYVIILKQQIGHSQKGTPLWSFWVCISLVKLRLAILAILKLRPQSLGVLAPVCSSMGFLCVSQSGRCFENPLGNLSVPWVSSSNCMAARLLKLIHIHILCFGHVSHIYISIVNTHTRRTHLGLHACVLYIYMHMCKGVCVCAVVNTCTFVHADQDNV